MLDCTRKHPKGRKSSTNPTLLLSIPGKPNFRDRNEKQMPVVVVVVVVLTVEQRALMGMPDASGQVPRVCPDGRGPKSLTRLTSRVPIVAVRNHCAVTNGTDGMVKHRLTRCCEHTHRDVANGKHTTVKQRFARCCGHMPYQRPRRHGKVACRTFVVSTPVWSWKEVLLRWRWTRDADVKPTSESPRHL